MPQLGPFRDYNEHDVLNVFAVSGYTADTTTILPRGTLVKLAGKGFKLDEPNYIEYLGNPSAFTPTNVVSQRYGAIPKVVPTTTGTEFPVGMTLFDIRETDENGELLKFRPRKAAELEAVISGQACPLVRKGLFAYSGITTGIGQTAVTGAGQITAGTLLYPGAGALSSWAVTGQGGYQTHNKIGIALGDTDSRGYTVVFLNIV